MCEFDPKVAQALWEILSEIFCVMQRNANQPGVSIELYGSYVSGADEKIASLPVLHEMGAGAPASECIIKRDCSGLECFLDELRGKNCSIFSSQSLKMALYIVL